MEIFPAAFFRAEMAGGFSAGNKASKLAREGDRRRRLSRLKMRISAVAGWRRRGWYGKYLGRHMKFLLGLLHEFQFPCQPRVKPELTTRSDFRDLMTKIFS